MRELNYFTPAGTPKGDWAYHQYGATLGGPIRAQQAVLLRQLRGHAGQAERDAHDLGADRRAAPRRPVRVGEPRSTTRRPAAANGAGRTAFTGNIIPQDRIDPIAMKIIGLMPLPNLPGETNNYFVAAPFEFNRWTLDTKVNWNATSKLNIFGRYSHLDFWTFNEAVYGDTLQGVPIAGGNPGTGQGYTANFSAGGTYAFSSDPRGRRALRLRPDVHGRRALRHRPEQGHGPARDSGSERHARLRRRHAGLRLQHVPGSSASPSSTCRTRATTISIRRS